MFKLIHIKSNFIADSMTDPNYQSEVVTSQQQSQSVQKSGTVVGGTQKSVQQPNSSSQTRRRSTAQIDVSIFKFN